MISDALDERRARREPTTATIEKQTVDTGGDVFEVDTATTVQTFQNANSLLTNDKFGFPRGAEVIAGRQLGQTPLMELTKNVLTDQLTGGDLTLPFAEDAETPTALEEFRDVVQAILASNHAGDMDFDDLVTAAINDFVDVGWGYWEVLGAGPIPVAQLKPVDALTIQHNLTDKGQFADDDPKYFHAPAAATATGSITPVEFAGDPEPLADDDLVAMRAPGTARSNDPYGAPPAVKAREFIEVIANATTDINRDYDDSQIPEGIFMAEGGAVDDLTTQLRNSRGDKRRAPVVDYEVDWLDVGYDTTETRIAEQEWFWKMLMAMFGYSRNEVGMTENTGLGTETPAQATLIYKKVFLPLAQTITTAIDGQILPQFDQYDGQFHAAIQGADPRQEVVEAEEARKRFVQGTMSYAEMKETLGEDVPEETTIDVKGTLADWANQPRWVFEHLVRVALGEADAEGASASVDEAEDFDGFSDPILADATLRRRFDVDPARVRARLAANTKQLENTIDVASSFIVSIAYDRVASFLQIEFEKEGSNAIYWYADVPEKGRASFFGLLRSNSKGSYFNDHIRHTGNPGYAYARVQ